MEPHQIPAVLARIVGEAPLPGLLFYVREADGEGRFVEIVGDGSSCLGRSVEELGRDALSWVDSVHPGDLDGVVGVIASLEPGESTTLEYRVVTAADGVKWVRDSVRRSGSEPDRLVGVVREATTERGLREGMAALEERMWRSRRLDSLGALAAGIAHDFNNLLTTVLASVQLLEGEPLSPAGREDLSVIREASLRGARMVRQILRFARRGSEPSPKVLDLTALVTDLRGILDRTLGEKCQLRLQAVPDLPSVRCDPGQIEQIVLNLVVNARDAMEAGGTVEIRLEAREAREALRTETRTLMPGPYVVLSVRDTGPGIPDEVRGRIFDAFFTTKDGPAGGSREGRSGSGFGLFTVQRIVRSYGGGITLRTSPGRGTTFEIWLPAWDPAASLPDVIEPGADAARGPRVLLVEPDRAVRAEVMAALGREGHRVVAVESAAAAIRVFDRSGAPFDLAIVSERLPDRPWGDVARALGRRRPELPVLTLAAADEGPPGPADGTVLTRPFTPEGLRAAIARAMEGGRGRGPDGRHQPSAVQ